MRRRNLADRPPCLAKEKTVASKFVSPETRIKLQVGLAQYQYHVIPGHPAHMFDDVERGVNQFNRRTMTIEHVERAVFLVAQEALEEIVAPRRNLSGLGKLRCHAIERRAHRVHTRQMRETTASKDVQVAPDVAAKIEDWCIFRCCVAFDSVA